MTTQTVEISKETKLAHDFCKTDSVHSATQKVAKNSFWLIAQPLILNIISIFAIAYIARTLGEADYGKFIFAFSFVAMFSPMVNMGLRPITVRRLAEDRRLVGDFLGKMLALRLFLALLTVAIIVIAVNLMLYPETTKTIVYIASLTIIFNAATSSFNDAFQGCEKMKYVALAQFIAGFSLTILSIVMLYLGWRLAGIAWVYVFGSFLGMVFSYWYLTREIALPLISVDMTFWKDSLYKGMPFFLPALAAAVGTRLGIVILSKMAGDTSVGVFGAANSLIERLLVIPEGICMAFFPTFAALYKNSKDDAGVLFRKFFFYLVLLGMPIATGVTILAKPIITTIYGVRYLSSVLTLQLLSWFLFFGFITIIQTWVIGAMHQEKKSAIILYFTTALSILLYFLLIPNFKEDGLAVVMVAVTFLTLVLFQIVVKKHMHVRLYDSRVALKICMANIFMGAAVFALKEFNIFISICVGMIVYAASVIALKLIGRSEIVQLTSLFTTKKGI